MTLLARRSFLTGLGALIAAPTVVRAASLMPVRGIVMPVYVTVRTGIPSPTWRVMYTSNPTRNPDLLWRDLMADRHLESTLSDPAIAPINFTSPYHGLEVGQLVTISGLRGLPSA